MKNVTVSLDDQSYSEARIKAAKAGKSLSRYMADLVKSDTGEAPWPGMPKTRREQLAALRKILDGPKWSIMQNGRMPDSDERNAR